MVHLGEVNPAVWDTVTERMEILLAKFKFKAEDISVDWRIQAAKFKLERELFEQYGVWKDIILHPTFQYAKQLAEDNIDFSFQLGDPVIPLATVIIILVMMHKRVSNTILAMIGGFMLNVNPFYVFLSLMTWYRWSHSKRPRQYVKPPRRSTSTTTSPTKNELKPTPFQASIIEKKGIEYDHVVVGSDIGSLYCAALLSRVGHRCCVLIPRGVHPLEVRTVCYLLFRVHTVSSSILSRFFLFIKIASFCFIGSTKGC